MGIKFQDVELFVETFRRAPVGKGAARRGVLTLGVQDVYFSYEELKGFLREKGVGFRELGATEILPTTGMAWAPKAERARLIHQKTLFAALGFEAERVQAMDGSGYEGADFVHDLNEPVGKEMEERFEVVFDGGTLEHVFSTRDAFFNMARMVKVGGLAIHHAPVDWPEHGFVNFNPTVFRDFYAANGFEEIDLRFTATGLNDATGRDYRFYEEFPGYLRPGYGLLLWAAYRKREKFAGVTPVQGRYREVWKRGK